MVAHIVCVSIVQIEARSVEHYKKLNIGMENKIIHLQQRLDEQVFPFLYISIQVTKNTNSARRRVLWNCETYCQVLYGWESMTYRTMMSRLEKSLTAFVVLGDFAIVFINSLSQVG